MTRPFHTRWCTVDHRRGTCHDNDPRFQGPEPRTRAGKKLLEREAYNSRSFALITAEAIVAIEREAAAPERALMAAVAASPWSFHRGTLRERLEWCRAQHQLAAGRLTVVPPRAVEENRRWHQDCADWYAEMVAMLPPEASS